MPKSSEVDDVVEWCNSKRKGNTRPYLIERNPFSNKYRWMMRFPLIEIDRPKQIATLSSLVYDSTTKTLWQNMGGQWMQVMKDERLQT